jgi:hypothetical protein
MRPAWTIKKKRRAKQRGLRMSPSGNRDEQAAVALRITKDEPTLFAAKKLIHLPPYMVAKPCRSLFQRRGTSFARPRNCANKRSTRVRFIPSRLAQAQFLTEAWSRFLTSCSGDRARRFPKITKARLASPGSATPRS